jgi:tripartite-type tricarboxylate transporter receptor subunit TctC
VFGVVVNGILGAKRMEEYDRLKELVEAAADDVAKATGGNKAAGTRVRKSMQEIKDAAQTVRKKILEVRSQHPS